MKTIEEKAKEYCKNGICKDCESSINCIPEEFTDRECILYGENRDSFVAGYKAAFEWISVDDELPKDGTEILVKNTEWTDCMFYTSDDEDTIIAEYTHWRPINND